MNGEMTVYFDNCEKYERKNITGIMFVNGTLVVHFIDDNGELKTLNYTRKSLKDGNVLTIY